MSRRRLSALVISTVVVVIAAATLSGTGATLAAFSDFDVARGQTVGAGTVVVRGGAGGAPQVNVDGLRPGVPQSRSFTVRYLGTMPADLALELRPSAGSSVCTAEADGTWRARPGGLVLVRVGQVWADYCALLSPGRQMPLADDVQPGSAVTVEVTLLLQWWSDHTYGALSEGDELVVTARQSDVGAFTDWVAGSLTFTTLPIKAKPDDDDDDEDSDSEDSEDSDSEDSDSDDSDPDDSDPDDSDPDDSDPDDSDPDDSDSEGDSDD